MGLFGGAVAHITGQKAYRTHVSANQLANEGKVGEAEAKYQQAYKLYEQAFADGPQKPSIHQGFAILLMRLGEFEKARDVMQQIRLMKNLSDEDWFDLRLNYSIYLWKTGQLDAAIDTVRRAAKFKMSAAVYTTLGMYLVDKARETGDFEEVHAFNREAMEYDDEDAGVLDNMGGMYEGMMERARAAGEAGRAAEYRRQAKDYFARAHAQKPRQITTIYELAKLHHEDGEDEQARKVLAAAQNLYFTAICPVSEAMMDALKREVG